MKHIHVISVYEIMWVLFAVNEFKFVLLNVSDVSFHVNFYEFRWTYLYRVCNVHLVYLKGITK